MSEEVVGKVSRVHWKAEEERSVLLFAEMLMESGQERWFGPAVIRAQQEVLKDPSRWRPKSSIQSQTAMLRPLAKQFLAEEKAAQEAREAQAKADLANQQQAEEQQRLADEQARQQEQQRLADEAAEEAAALQRSQQRLAEEGQALVTAYGIEDTMKAAQLMQPTFLKNIMGIIGHQFEEALVMELQGAMARAHLRVAKMATHQVKAFEELPPARPHRPKVLVAGFKNHLNNELNDEFKEHIDLTFFDADATSKQVRHAAAMCDHVLVIKKFVGHSYVDALKSHPGYFLVHGSISSAKEKLLEIAAQYDGTK